MASSIIKGQLHIGGMTCVNCQNKIEKKLQNTAGIVSARVSFAKGTADIEFDTDIISLSNIIRIIEKLDYQILPPKQKTPNNLQRTAGLLILIFALYWLLQQFGILNLLAPGRLADTKMGYGMLFVTGLVTSVHCIAMCGGINLSQCLPRRESSAAKESQNPAFLPAFLYNFGRVISYTVIGLLLGTVGMLFGSSQEMGLSLLLQGILKLIAGIFMIITGFNMLGIFPGLRRLSLRMPAFAARKVNREKARNHTPLVIGLLNGLMPCGPLQSMQLVALASGSPLTGALSMLMFSLGTVPLMLGLGSFVSALGKRFTRQVMNAGAVLVVVLGISMLSQSGSLMGLPFRIPDLTAQGSDSSGASSETNAEIVDGEQIVTSTLSPGRYPNITVQAGTPVRWVINAPEGSINGCNYKMFIQEYGIEHTFQTGENVITFTPTESGTVRYSCWMGMISGNIFVTDEKGETVSADGIIEVPVPSGYQIPTAELAIAQMADDENGTPTQTVTAALTDEGFQPAVIVVQSGCPVIWNIDNRLSGAEAGTTLLAPLYSTKLSLTPGENQIYLTTAETFEVSTGDHAFYAYIKAVDDLENIDETAIREEAASFETLIYPDGIFSDSDAEASCCQ